MMDMEKRDLILGEDCAWFDRTPNSADAGLRQCLTSDGIPLVDKHWSGWGGETFIIVALTRRTVSLEELQPPRDYLDPAAGGFAGVSWDEMASERACPQKAGRECRMRAATSDRLSTAHSALEGVFGYRLK